MPEAYGRKSCVRDLEWYRGVGLCIQDGFLRVLRFHRSILGSQYSLVGSYKAKDTALYIALSHGLPMTRLVHAELYSCDCFDHTAEKLRLASKE
jgi:hypothetical protein